jgi:cytochrome c-type biogenesis protein CcmE
MPAPYFCLDGGNTTMEQISTLAPGEVSKAPRANATVGTFERHRKTEGKFNPKFLIMGLVIVAAALFIVFSAMQGATVYYLEVNEVQTKLANKTIGTEPVRMNGQVVPGTIVKSADGNTHTFKVSDMKQKDRVITATFRGVAPDTFNDEAQVVLTGKVDNSGVFVSTEMLAKCPSKYSTTAG